MREVPEGTNVPAAVCRGVYAHLCVIAVEVGPVDHVGDHERYHAFSELSAETVAQCNAADE